MMTKSGSTSSQHHVSEKPAKKAASKLHDKIMGSSEGHSRRANPQLRTRQEDL